MYICTVKYFMYAYVCVYIYICTYVSRYFYATKADKLKSLYLLCTGSTCNSHGFFAKNVECNGLQS